MSRLGWQAEIGIPLALPAVMAGMIWISDRDAGIRQIFGELMPEAELLDPHELRSRLALGQRPEALVIDGTQLLELPARLRAAAMALPRTLICTGLLLASLPATLVSGSNVAVLAKPFCIDDLVSAVAWLRDVVSTGTARRSTLRPMLHRHRARAIRGGIAPTA